MIEQPRFSLLQKLGNGAYADVYQGVDAKFNGRKVAIKCYQSDASRNMGLCSLIIREISILKKVGYHPHIVQALDIVMASNGKIFLVMELMDTNLYEYQKIRRNTITLRTIQKTTTQILDAVQFLHNNHIIHRDLKTDNILVDITTQDIKLCDLGLARSVIPPCVEGKSLPMQAVCYAAPEVLLGDKFYTSAIDVFSVGCILGEMLCNDGEGLFDRRSYPGSVHQGKDKNHPHAVSLDLHNSTKKNTQKRRDEHSLAWLNRMFEFLGPPTMMHAPQLLTLPVFPSCIIATSNISYRADKVMERMNDEVDPRFVDVDAAHLMLHLLEIDPRKRIDCNLALQHTFITNIKT